MRRFNILLLPLLAVLSSACGQNTSTSSNGKVLNADGKNQSSQIDSSKYIPKPGGWVNDYVNIFSEAQKRSLDSVISNYEKRTSVEIAVATIDSSLMGPIAFDSYTLLMLRTWGVGKKEKNNGILIVIAPAMRRMRIQNGYGIEQIISNSETAAIINSSFTPHFKSGNYYEGTRQGILKIISTLDAHRQ